MQPKVSVLMPSLNVYPYIEECLQSVLHQTLHDIEIICIDAGSVDGTWELLRRYAGQDERMQLVASPKASYGAQMNQGLSRAQGEYIAIVETDDYIKPHMLERLYVAAKRQNLDIVKGDYTAFTHIRGQLFSVPKKLSQVAEDYGQVFHPLDTLTPFGWEMFTWAGLYRRQMLLDYNVYWHETPGASFQDIGFWFQTFAAAGRVALVDEPLYCYRRDNPGSSVQGNDHLAAGLEEFAWLKNMFGRFSSFWRNLYPAFANELVRFSFMAYPRISEAKRSAYAEQAHGLMVDVEPDERMLKLISPYNYHLFRLLHDSPEDFAAAWHDERAGVAERQEKLAATLRQYPAFVICSAGSHGVNLQAMLYEKFGLRAAAYADNDQRKQGGDCNGVKVLSLAEAVECYAEAYFLIANKLHGEELAENLRDLGVSAGKMQVVPVERLIDAFL